MSRAGDVSKGISSDRILNATGAGTSTVDSSVIDMQDYRAVLISLQMGAIVSGAVTSAKLQHGDAPDGSDMADIESSSKSIADTDDNKQFEWELDNPSKRYLRLRVLRATQNATIDGASSKKLKPRKFPVTDGSGVAAKTIVRAPVTGVA